MSPRNERYRIPRNEVRKFRRESKKIIHGPFICPRCCKNKFEISIDGGNKKVHAKCFECGIEGELVYVPVFEPVDYYNKFVDKLMHP